MDEENNLTTQNIEEVEASQSSKKILMIISSIVVLAIIVGLIILFLRMSPQKITEEQLSTGITVGLKENQKVKFMIDGEENSITVESIDENSVSINLEDETPNIKIGEEKKFDLNNDDIYDLNIKVEGVVDGKANLEIKKIEEAISSSTDVNNNDSTINGDITQDTIGEDSATNGDTGQDITADDSCTENWNCASWTTCSNNIQTRTCTDSNNCGTNADKPLTTRSCSTNCTTHYEYKCYNNDVYWYNSCGDKEDMKVGCSSSLKCENGECVTKSCQELGYSICISSNECLGQTLSGYGVTYPSVCCNGDCGSTMTCQEAGYTLCPDDDRCSGIHYSSSDSIFPQVCCKGTCDTRPTCNEAGGYMCSSSSWRKCIGTPIDTSDTTSYSICCPSQPECVPQTCSEKNKYECNSGQFCREYNNAEQDEDSEVGQMCCKCECETLPVCGNGNCEFKEDEGASIWCYGGTSVGTPPVGLCQVQACSQDCG